MSAPSSDDDRAGGDRDGQRRVEPAAGPTLPPPPPAPPLPPLVVPPPPTTGPAAPADPAGENGALTDPPAAPGSMPATGRGRRLRTLLVALATALAVAALGVPLGLLWRALAPSVPIIKTADGGALTDPQPQQFVAADGWFAVLGAGFGVLCAIGAWVLLRRHRGPVGLLAVVAGAVAAAPIAWGLGRQIGLSEYRRLLHTAAVGDVLNKPPDLRAGRFELVQGFIPTIQGDLLLPAFGAAVAYTLLAGWSRYASLHAEPGEPAGAELMPGRATQPAHAPAVQPGSGQPGHGQSGNVPAGNVPAGNLPAGNGPAAGAPVGSGERDHGHIGTGERDHGRGGSDAPVSSDSPQPPAPPAAPGPPAPGGATPPRD
ncbi:Protein of unknown function [Micromonospora pattaloongensis]|uniref:DUF2567 domain-containing protein n=1 Tax=Micromonospora pattaloongensis TaxID=405436 RepID=A0A1H3Q3Y8_9ACTN|nr:DUF2567 domain-containing protein [Micromonospora pattaloongensis]SDZ07960.1 Protein of unknown function [Micromonospora pattaloongensis]